MSHFYRCELGRIMIWRQRLDTTTTWAITTTSSIFTVAFTLRDVPHLIFFFNLAIVAVMLWIDARRYRFYDAFRARVRMLESHFLVPMIMRNDQMIEGDWRKLVSEGLLISAFKISRFEAIGRRFKRNYGFIIIIIAAWITKIYLHSVQKIDSPRAFYDALAIGQVPSWLVAFALFGTFISVLGIIAYISQRSTGEISEFGKTSRTSGSVEEEHRLGDVDRVFQKETGVYQLSYLLGADFVREVPWRSI